MRVIKKFKNTGTIISIVSLLVIILSTEGIDVNSNKIMTIVKAVCAIGVILGVLNNPNTKGIDSLVNNE
ncbi:MAG: phage holin [Sarcina sp.]